MKKNNHTIKKAEDIIVTKSATRNISSDCRFMSKMPIAVFVRLARISKNITGDMLRLIKNEFHTLKHAVMQGKEMLKVHTHLKNGKSYAENIIGDVRIARNGRNLLN